MMGSPRLPPAPKLAYDHRMLMRGFRAYVAGFFVGAALISILAWALGLLPPEYVKYCYEKQGGYEECASYHIALVAFWQIGKGLNWLSPAVTAIATGFIAWFTIVLSRIGKQQARDARVVQRAYVFVRQPESTWAIIGGTPFLRV